MTRRRTQLVFLIVIGLLPGLVAADEREDAVRRDVMAYFLALRVSDFPALTRLTCPAVVSSVGGAEAFIARLQTMDEARLGEWTGIVDPDDDAFAIVQISHPHITGQRQRPVRRRHCVHIVRFLAGCRPGGLYEGAG